MAKDAREQLTGYLKDAHAMEQQALKVAEKASEIAGDPKLEQIYQGHVMETREHIRYTEERLEGLGESTSTAEDLAGRLGAMGIGMLAQASADTPAKVATVAYAFESFEVATWELIKRVAERADDNETIEAADRILADERLARDKVADNFDLAVVRALEASGADEEG
jgi:ferritin-like metal-binding protein YciE